MANLPPRPRPSPPPAGNAALGSVRTPGRRPDLTDQDQCTHRAHMRGITVGDAKNRSTQQATASVTRNETPVGGVLSVEQVERLRGTAWDRLAAAMDAMNREAAAKGLTPAALESLLSDES